MDKALPIFWHCCFELELILILTGIVDSRTVFTNSSPWCCVNISLIGANEQAFTKISKVWADNTWVIRRITISAIRTDSNTTIPVHNLKVIITKSRRTWETITSINITSNTTTLTRFTLIGCIITKISCRAWSHTSV